MDSLDLKCPELVQIEESEERSDDGPWHRRFAPRSRTASSSSFSLSSNAGHEMVGKKMDSSTSIDTFRNESMSKLSILLLLPLKEPIEDRDRFQLFEVMIIGRSLLITGS
jgi:hypothetical protein